MTSLVIPDTIGTGTAVRRLGHILMRGVMLWLHMKQCLHSLW